MRLAAVLTVGLAATCAAYQRISASPGPSAFIFTPGAAKSGAVTRIQSRLSPLQPAAAGARGSWGTPQLRNPRRMAPLKALALPFACAAAPAASAAPLGIQGLIMKYAGLSLGVLQSSQWWVWSMLLVCSTIGVAAEERTKIGSALSSPLITMAAALFAVNTGLLPLSSPVYSIVNSMLVPLAIPLLLLDADLRRVVTQTGRLLGAFVIGSLGTVLGTVLAVLAVPLSIGADGWKIAAALASRHIGGAVNYVAVSETLQMSAEFVAAGIAADNLVVSLYFAVLFTVAGRVKGCGPETQEEEAERRSRQGAMQRAADEGEGDTPALMYLKALTIAAGMCLVGGTISQTVLRGSISPIPVVSLLAVLGATAFPRAFSRITEPGGHIAVILMNIFFAVTGASGRIERVISSAPRLFVFSMIQLLGHLAFLLGVGRFVFRLPYRELLLASNANVGGPTTAAAMAGSKQWRSLVLPGILTGIFGYATGTFIGLLLGRLLLIKMMP